MAQGKPGKASEDPDRAGAVDEASAESFPASDPPAFTAGGDADDGGTGGDPHADEAKGTPHSERHATETAAGRSESRQPAEHKTH